MMPDGSSYDDIDKAVEWVTTSEDSLITHLIQHPIPIPAPMDKKQDERGLMLTKKEQKKMRRQRRQAELEDKRDRQKMGLLPPDPPKGESIRRIGKSRCSPFAANIRSPLGQLDEGPHVRCGPGPDKGRGEGQARGPGESGQARAR